MLRSGRPGMMVSYRHRHRSEAVSGEWFRRSMLFSWIGSESGTVCRLLGTCET